MEVAFRYARSLIDQALDPSNTSPFKTIAKVHYWTSQSMPFARGSAAIADATVKILMLTRGYKLRRWKQGVSPDYEAFFRSEDDFVSNYNSFFE